MSITSYSHRQIRGFAGAVDGPIDHDFTKTRVNKMLAQAGTLTVGGTADDGDYTVTVTDPNGIEIASVVFTREDSETNQQISDALEALLIKALILKATVVKASLVNTVTFANSNISYTVVASGTGGTGTLVWAQTVAAGGSAVPFGRFVRGGGDGISFRPLVTGSVIGDVIGVVGRNLTVQNPETGVPAGREGDIVGVGPMLVYTEQAVTPADTVYIRKESGAGGTMVGVVRKDGDTNTAISAATVCKFEESAAAGSVVRVMVNIPLMAA